MSAIAGILNYNEASVSIETDCQDMMQALQKYLPMIYNLVWQLCLFWLSCQWITPESIHERLPYYDEHNKLPLPRTRSLIIGRNCLTGSG